MKTPNWMFQIERLAQLSSFRIAMHSDDVTGSEAAVQGIRESCPLCGATDAVLTLLTSMTRYFACRRCQYRWRISIVAPIQRENAPPVTPWRNWRRPTRPLASLPPQDLFPNEQTRGADGLMLRVAGRGTETGSLRSRR
jgi:hypothetical protein